MEGVDAVGPRRGIPGQRGSALLCTDLLSLHVVVKRGGEGERGMMDWDGWI